MGCHLLLRIMQRLARYSHPLLKKPGQRKLEKYGTIAGKHQPVFIVGAPRSGSTILYQVLTHVYDVLYIDNLVSVFYRDFFHGFCLSRLIFQGRSHGCFQSTHGDTYDCGLHGPAECGDFWYRWLTRDKHYIAEGEIDQETCNEISKNLFSVMNRFDRPLVIKNLNAGQRLGLIRQVAPGAKFIFIRRDPLYTAQSIWESKQRVGLDPGEWWSIMPGNWEELRKMDSHRQVVRQVYYLEKQVMTDRLLFPGENFIIIHYDDFCRRTEAIIEQLGGLMGEGIKRRKHGVIPALASKERQKLGDEDFQKLRDEVEQLDWEKYPDL